MWIKSKEFKKILGLSNQALYERAIKIQKSQRSLFLLVRRKYCFWDESRKDLIK